ncbi:hypothetical protein [Sulfurimonas sp. HSL3-7]|uniref:NifB/NifX family molybdenum-iron cluster-binding protein n=1 Tax=Sulfonitrofixus jiaomeiensis TaxID=3131938 RepID=UPI0031F7D57F
MKIAVPLNADNSVYHSNPWTAPAFAVYQVTDEKEKIIFDCVEHKKNPWAEEDESVVFDPMMRSDRCNDRVKNDLDHLADHYIILEAINGCDYIIAETCCSNVEKVLEKGGIKIYKLPPIIKDPDLAVKNLLVNLGFAIHLHTIKKAAR